MRVGPEMSTEIQISCVNLQAFVTCPASNLHFVSVLLPRNEMRFAELLNSVIHRTHARTHTHTDIDHRISVTPAVEVCYEPARDRCIPNFTSLSLNSELSVQNVSMPQTSHVVQSAQFIYRLVRRENANSWWKGWGKVSKILMSALLRHFILTFALRIKGI